MKAFAHWISNRGVAWTVVVVVTIMAGAGLIQLRNIQQDDDLLAFLPRENPDVGLFYEVNKRFGSLDLALVGVETENVFDPAFLKRLKLVTRELKDLSGLDQVLSLANVVDFTPDLDKGGIVTAPTLRVIPRTSDEMRELRERVMSKDHLVGNLVSRDARAVQILCFLAYGADQRKMADAIRSTVEAVFPDDDKYWGGGPFISTYIYNSTQQDIRKLTPWAVLAIVIILMLTFRNVIGVGLVLLSTAMGIMVSLGLMATFRVPFNIVLGSMPVILFAVGSAYGIHVLARYYALLEKEDCRSALVRTVSGIGPVVLAAGLTTAAGLLSFVMMDIGPLRTFGLFTALGILATLAFSLTFIPAVICLCKLTRKPQPSGALRVWMMHLSVFAQRHRLSVGLVLGLLAAAGLSLISQVDTRMETSTFFSRGSPPDRAERFMEERFGGSQFVQIHLRGDLGDPHTLRELRRVADRISLLPHVSSVLHIGQAIAQVNEAFVGQRRIPDTSEQLGLLYSFLTGDPSVGQLVTRDREQALLHIKVDSSSADVTEQVLAEIERLVGPGAPGRWAVAGTGPEVDARRRDLALGRIQAVAHSFGVGLEPAQVQRVRDFLPEPAPAAAADTVRPAIEKFLRSDECAVDLTAPNTPAVEDVVAALVALGPDPSDEAIHAALARVADRPEESDLVQDLGFSVAAVLRDIWKGKRVDAQAMALIAAAGLRTPEGDAARRFKDELAMALLDLENPTVMLPAPPGEGSIGLAMRVTGVPVMHRGMSVSVRSNQFKSLAFALVLVVLIMAVLFRSVFSGFLVATPVLMTLLVIYGGMGLLGVRLDIGTSMLASLILGAGVDYAVHLASAWHATGDEPLAKAAARAADRTGPAIWTNAIMVCVGFFVLTLGEARPVQNVGSLTAAAMIVAAAATFLAIPALARRRCYRQSADASGLPDSTEVEEALAGKMP